MNTDTRAPGTPQGMLLGVLSLVGGAASILLAPVLPAMVEHFSATDPNAQAKVMFAFSLPALVVAISSLFIGIFLDKYGRKNILVVGLTMYSLVGILPAIIDVSLNTLLLLRVFLGFFEAIVMACGATLIGDYFTGAERKKWFVVQTIFVSLAGIILIPLGGALGEISWNAPFFAYGAFFIGVPLCMILLHEPEKNPQEPPAGQFPWNKVLTICGFGIMCAFLMILIPVQMPFLLKERGIDSPWIFSMSTMANTIAILVGSIIFKLRSEGAFKTNLTGALICCGIGVGLFVGNGSFPLTIVGAVVAGLGMGFMVPCLITQLQSHLPFEQRGRGTSWFNTFFFLGHFSGPLIMLAIVAAVGTLPNALLIASGACFVFAFFAVTLVKKSSETIGDVR